jgi:YD repeat-containing protein
VYEVFDKERGEWYASMHSGERKYEYDAQGNQISDTYGIRSPLLNGKFRVIRKSEKEYDKKGRLITQRDYKRPYTNEDDEMKLNVTHHYTYDKQGRLKSVVRESEDDYYNKEEHYTYDKQGRLISFVRDGGTFIPQKEEYYYDTHGNLIQIATFLLFEGEWDHDWNQTFTYDQDTPVSSVMGLTCPEVLNTEKTLRKKLNLTSKPLSVSLDLDSPKRYHASDEVVYYYSDIDTPSSLATNIHLSQQDSVKRNEYLVKLAREVVLNFGPGYYRENMNPEVSAIRMYLDSTHVERFPEDRKNIGRKYYVVTFPYDHTQEQLEWGYAAKVEIWEDDGEPKGVMFGCNLGYHFTFTSYREWVKMGIKRGEIMPY